MRATPADFVGLQRWTWGEFRHPDRINVDFLRWLDAVTVRASQLYGATLPFRKTSDGRAFVPVGGSKTSNHLFDPADAADDFSAIDIKYPWLGAIGGKTDGTKLAAITEAVITTPRPAAMGGYEFGIEHGAPAGPHLHLALRPLAQPLNWLFAR